MPELDLNMLRNIGIMAHIDAGKTTTTERILYFTGKSHKIGEVDDGEAVMDWMEQEQQRGITIQSAATTIYWKQYHINLIDTPGHVDFTAEVERSLRVLDGAIAIFDAVHGVEPQTETVWRQAEHYHVPCIGYVNKMDRIGANFFQVLESIRAKLNIIPVAVQLPIGQGNDFEGVIDLIELCELHFDPDSNGELVISSPIAPERQEQALQLRESLIDILSTVSEPITDRYLAGESIESDFLKKELRKAVLKRTLLPIYAGASRRNIGVQPLIDAVLDFLPAPDETIPVIGHTIKNGLEVKIPCDPHAHPLGLVFKIQNDREAGSLCYVRVYSGSIKTGDVLFNIGKRKRERVNRILRMHSNKSEPLDVLTAGDIGVIIGMKQAQTGDTVGSEGWPVMLEKMIFPEPVISISIEPKNVSEQEKLKEVLTILSKEDPTFTTKENKETGQLIISGMGELHLDVLVTRIIKEFKVEARIGNPQVSYRESVTKPVEYTEHFSRIIAGKENTATLTVQIAPQGRGQGNTYTCEAHTKDIPAGICAAIERGFTASFASGIVLGYPCIDIAVKLLSLQYSELSSSEFAFEACASRCFDKACREAEPILLEPIMLLNIIAPKDSIGAVMSLVTQRGGQILSMDSKQSLDDIKALAPMAKMFRFMNDLRGISQGRATFTMEFSHFEKR